MKSIRPFSILTLLCLVCMAGCAATSSYHQQRLLSSELPIVLLNRDLERTLEVEGDALAIRDQHDRLRVEVPLLNKTDNEILHLQARTIWRDEYSNKLYGEGAWELLALMPQQTTVYAQTAMTPEAEHYQVQIRYFAPQSGY